MDSSFKTRKRVETVSILQTQKEQQQEERVEIKVVEQSSNFTLEELRKAWFDYTTTIPTETILVSTMKSCSLELLDNFRIKAVVANFDHVVPLNELDDDV